MLYMHTFGHITVQTPLRALLRNGLSLESPAIDFAYKTTTKSQPCSQYFKHKNEKKYENSKCQYRN